VTNTDPALAHRSLAASFGRRLLSRLFIASVLASAGLAAPAHALAQGGDTKAADDAKRANLQALGDFIHYTRIARYDLANAMWKELASRNLSDTAFVDLVESSGDVPRFEDAVQRAMRTKELADSGAAIAAKYNQGKLSRARNPQEIARNIAELTGTARGRLLATARLKAAGEYAMPQLLEACLDRANPLRQGEAQRVVADLGRQSVIPLCAALVKMPAAQQEQVADILGQIPWKTSLPFLSDVAATTKTDAVRDACRRAIAKIGASDASTADLYRSLAEAYYAQRPEVLSFPNEDFQLLWDYEPGAGLTMTAIRTPVFHEAMAMSLAERAMTLESASGAVNPDTLALWVASNFSREIDTPKGYVNPAYPVAGAVGPGQEPRRTAEYFAVAAGPDVSQRVLARAVDAKDTPLARRALAAVERTAGVTALASGPNGRTPLVEALAYPNRRVQYEAALAIAAAQPNAEFPGADRVVPTLAGSVRGATQQFAAVVAADTEQYQIIRGVLQKLGYTVMPQGRALADLAAPIAESPAVDLLVAAGLNAERSAAAVDEVRGTPKTAATPVVLLTGTDAYFELRQRYEGIPGVAVRQLGLTADNLTATVNDLVNAYSGGAISPDEARDYTRRALAALRDVAVSGRTILRADDAALPLIAALPEAQGSMKLDIADILARVGQDRAQRAVMDAAVASSGQERIALLGKVAQSAKRFGNLLEPRHTARLLDMATKGSDDEATAAAGLMGALNLPNADVMPLVMRKPR
jgi:hypothetical protein